jgi:GH25 family lysozyme M1 (1,4-beta-N-acetylmuramidase)
VTRFDGADLSHHQDDAGPIDWPTLRAASLGAWIATKATQSTGYTDPTCAAHRAQMATQGFIHRGLYHWLSPNTDPAAQAAHFLDVIGTLHPGEFAMLDAEERGITAAMVLAWLAAVEQVTRRPAAVYTGAYVAGGTIWQSTAIRHSIYGPRPMHLAAYTTEEKALALPGVAAYPWDAWQYSSNGPVPGVVGRCDMNRIDNRAAYDLACGIQAAPLPPQEDDMPTVITNLAPRQFQGVIYQPGEIKWALMDDGTKRHMGIDHKLFGSPAGTPVSNADLDACPDYVPPVTVIPPVTVPPITVPPLTGHLVADVDTGTWHITGSVG